MLVLVPPEILDVCISVGIRVLGDEVGLVLSEEQLEGWVVDAVLLIGLAKRESIRGQSNLVCSTSMLASQWQIQLHQLLLRVRNQLLVLIQVLLLHVHVLYLSHGLIPPSPHPRPAPIPLPCPQEAPPPTPYQSPSSSSPESTPVSVYSGSHCFMQNFVFIKSCGSQIRLKFSEVALLGLHYSPK